MHIAELITIGDEILIGQTIDTNSAWMGKNLNQIGVEVANIQSIKDEKESIISALDLASSRSNIVLITGGLGPTQDDITKEVLSEYFQTKLVRNKEALEKIVTYFEMRGRKMLESNIRQADLPENCTVLNNLLGTASGMWFERKDVVFVSMPGVPYEMKGIMETEVIPRLKTKFSLGGVFHKTIMTEGIGESFLVEIIKDWEKSTIKKGVKVAYLPSPGIVKVRLSIAGNSKSKLEALLIDEARQLKELIPSYCFGEDNIQLEQVIGNLLLEKKKTLVCAESCTGGNISRLLTSCEGSSAYFLGGIVAYHNEVKQRHLSVSSDSLHEFGAVSEEVVKQMALGALKNFNSDFALATSGIAGPTGGSEEKPVGTVWIAMAHQGGVEAKKLLFEKHRERNITRASLAALSLLRRHILDSKS